MADLVIKTESTEVAAKQLGLIVDELKDMGQTWDDGRVWGDDVLKQAMQDFVDDWWVKREQLTDTLSDLQQKLQKIGDQYDDLELKLTDSLEDS